jgi:sugar (glycoside-pentoside-hexuronide) transporter
MKKANADYVTSRAERTSYGMYFVGQLFFYILVSSFLQLYMTDIGIPAAVVGGVFIIAKIWDAINDPIFGVIVDKVNMKKGKYVPWVRLSTILIPITTVIMFAVPLGVSVQIKIIWAFVAYLLWDTSYTICDVPIYALATSMSSVMKERNTLLIYAKLFGMIGGLITTIAIPLLYPGIGWTLTALILAVLGIAAMLPVGFIAKERHEVREEASPTVKALLHYLVKNKFLLIFSGAVLIVSITGTSGPVLNYVAIHCLGGPQWITILAAVMVTPMLLSIPLLQWLSTKFDKYFIYNAGIVITIVTGLLLWVTGYDNLPLMFSLLILRYLFATMNVTIATMVVADCAEFGTYKTGERAQGVAFSIQTFTAKTTAAISGAVTMFVLGFAGFIEGEGVAQSAETVKTIWLLYSAFPVITSIIALILMIFYYKLKDRDVQVMARYNQGEIRREEMDASLSRQY